MEALCEQNQAKLSLREGESFFIKPSLLTGYRRYDWTLPFPFGSPFFRLYHRCWMLKQVEAIEDPVELKLQGVHPRGNFVVLELKKGERYHVAIRYLAGFSGETASLHTHIKVSPGFWLLHQHFFPVFEGPGTILLYGPASLEQGGGTDFVPMRLVAFEAGKTFRPIAPQPRRLGSQLINLLFSNEVIWQFKEPGRVMVEAYNEAEAPGHGGMRGFFRHLLGFFRI
jgi:hypothetical protein